MRFVERIRLRLRTLFCRSQVERELDEELRFHLEQQIEENEAAGMSPREARFAALRAFGGREQVKEECRDRRGLSMIDETLRDVGYGMRVLRKNPGFTVVAALTLALGIGANAAIFSAVNEVLLEPLPHEEPGDLVYLWEHCRGDRMSVAYPNFEDWRDQTRAFASLAAYRFTEFNLSGWDQPLEVSALMVSASLFPLLGVEHELGRSFLDEEDKRGGDPVAMLSHALWREQFGANPDIIGRSVSLNKSTYTVVGILSPGFVFPPDSGSRVGLFVPIGPYAESLRHGRTNRPGIRVIGRLAQTSTLDGAAADLQGIALRLAREHPESNSGIGIGMVTLHEQIVANVKPALLTLTAAAGFLLLVACANLTNLLFTKTASRRREISMRVALGARPNRIIRQLLTESGMLCMLGGLVGLLLANGIIDIFRAETDLSFPLGAQVRINGVVVLFTLMLSLLAGTLVGLEPARSSLRGVPFDFLGTSGGSRTPRVGAVLVVAEVGLALVLLIGAGLMIRSLVHMANTSPGLKPEGVLTLRISLPEVTVPRRVTFFNHLLERVSAMPGVQSAAVTRPLPLSMRGWQQAYYVEGETPPPRGQEPYAEFGVVSPDYFRSLGIPLLRGRSFTEHDTVDAPLVVIIDERFAERYWPDEDPIGKRVKMPTHDSDTPWMEVIGVAGHVNSRGIAEESPVQIYVPFEQKPRRSMHLVIRSDADPAYLTAGVRSAVNDLDQEQPVADVRTMEDYLARTMATQDTWTLLMGSFAAVALLLSASGIYGVISHSVSQRTHEIGVRIAMGAKRSQVLLMVLRRSMTLVLMGLCAGVAAALALTRLMAGLLYAVEPTDPITFLTVCVVMVSVAAVASVLPSRRAATIDPALVLRSE